MKLFENKHVFGHTWDKVTAAHWVKYPSDLTSHVVAVDYLSRHVDSNNHLVTERLLTCKQHVPKFVLSLFGEQAYSYVYERSTVDPVGKQFESVSVNLTYSNVITVEERCRFTARSDETVFSQRVAIDCDSGVSFLKSQIEAMGMHRFQSNAINGRNALENTLKA